MIQDVDAASCETRDEPGASRVLLTKYLKLLKRKKELKLQHVTSKINLYILTHVVKCLPPVKQKSSVWWNSSNDSDKGYTKVEYMRLTASSAPT